MNFLDYLGTLADPREVRAGALARAKMLAFDAAERARTYGESSWGGYAPALEAGLTAKYVRDIPALAAVWREAWQ